jgi:hypothetical protein
MFKKIQIAFITVCALGLIGTASVRAQGKLASNELVSQLSKQLNITPAQAAGGAGSLFGFAKTQLSPQDFGKVSKAVPGMNDILKAAPKTTTTKASTKSASGSPTDILSSMAGAMPSQLGGMASMVPAFQKLGLSPDMVAQFVPVITDYVSHRGGAGVGGLLSGVFGGK